MRGICVELLADAHCCCARPLAATHRRHAASPCGHGLRVSSVQHSRVRCLSHLALVCGAASDGGTQPEAERYADAVPQHGEQPSTPGDGTQRQHPQYERLLQMALSQDADALLDFAAEHRDELTLRFLLWLADR